MAKKIIAKELMLTKIAKEIEGKYDCRVTDIRYAMLLSLCVMVKIKFNDDFYYKPFKDFPEITSICFSERSVCFSKRLDLFDCVQKIKSNMN